MKDDLRKGTVLDIMFATPKDDLKKKLPAIFVYVPLEKDEIEMIKNYDKEFEYDITPRAICTHFVFELHLKEFGIKFYFIICPIYFAGFYQFLLNYKKEDLEFIICLRTKENSPIATFNIKYPSDFFKIISFINHLLDADKIADPTGSCDYCCYKVGG